MYNLTNKMYNLFNNASMTKNALTARSGHTLGFQVSIYHNPNDTLLRALLVEYTTKKPESQRRLYEGRQLYCHPEMDDIKAQS